MALRYHALSASAPLPPPRDGQWLELAVGSEAPLRLPRDWFSLWLPLRGDLQLQDIDCQWRLRSRQAQMWCSGALSAQGTRDSLWLCLAGSPAAWARHFASVPGLREPLAWQHAAPRRLRRQLVQLARALRDAPSFEVAQACTDHSLATLLAEQQQAIAARLPRCRGRNQSHRRQTLLRLLHVRHLVRSHVEADDDSEPAIDLAWLADRAHYSPGHLIRIHREVFGETPSEYLARLRSARAWRLVRDTAMPVGEITQVLGFESQSAFCRAFKHTFGMTATQARRIDAASVKETSIEAAQCAA
ncbi:helix-turn-helix transcriptional regulator [Lysobacter sp. S4-A87]|uniref:helix-turn-helix transcriptional regulator n=1 Tax=Lysobacter sp. S4-A87 TaxID=2925843 RepID=UPI001F5367E0|nr:helix-turn-helix transcriptional regulator [Lysobacter sp. S4-A87]UNK49113.1 helix-turn-helix transcriptional regulator [Lysobacter sp. S4-A87]